MTFTESLLFWLAKSVLPLAVVGLILAAVVARAVVAAAADRVRKWWRS